MIRTGNHFIGFEISKHTIYSLGTPHELKTYLENTHAFLFDLDGTLVLTDDIYFKVWQDLLETYQITLTPYIFKTFIQGNNDLYVVNRLLKNICVDLPNLSKRKDQMFLQHLDKIKTIDGVLPFFENIYLNGHKICIVTNCNRSVAERMVEQIGIRKYVDFIIASGDCENPKPSPEPYLLAMKKYNIGNNQTFIFEDSKTGIISGKTANPKCLIGVTTLYDKAELSSSGVDISIDDYLAIDIREIIEKDMRYLDSLKIHIIQSLPFEITRVEIGTTTLKGGFISDVITVQLVTNSEIHHCVLKIEKENNNALSQMATDLDLYNREYHFYQDVAKYCNIKTADFYGIVKDDKGQNIGLLLKNMFYYGDYKLNLNLNRENIDISLKIVSRMAKFHSLFWNKRNKSHFPQLKECLDPIFSPKWGNYIHENLEPFILKWSNILTPLQIDKLKRIADDFSNIQQQMACGATTIIHGDIKSPNILYDIKDDYEPCFIDWQHCIIGKGVQDLVFFIIESFDITNIDMYFQLFKIYYYTKLREFGITGYSFAEYETDIKNAICYVPVFTAVWFGTLPHDDLIDKNFPFFFIQKLFNAIDNYV
jgi:HAD superfamily hydrolase (TIGR01509 family)